jgi:predicted amidophosphoribosyltransferase
VRVGAEVTGIVAASNAIAASLVPPPADADGICPRCRTWTIAEPDDIPHRRECENCRELQEALELEPLRFAVVSLYKKPSNLRDWLTRYKGREDERDVYEPAFVDIVRSIIGRFVIEHGEALEAAAGPFDSVVVVPSTTRASPHPLEAILASLELDVPLLPLLERGCGDLGFRRPSKTGYQVAIDCEPLRVLLVDDVYTTGSRINSAASALGAAGHQVAAAFVIARRINPDYSEAASRIWHNASATPFDWSSSPWLPI